MSGINEFSIIQRAARGDRVAQAQLVTQAMPMIYRVAFRMLADASEAEDVTQETFLRAWKQLDRWQPKARFSTWACTVALNICRDRLRKKRPVFMAEPPEQIDQAQRPEQSLASQQFAVQMETYLAALPERQREALILSALEGLGNKQTAAIMDISVPALESLLARARRSLRAQMDAAAEGQAE